MAVLTVGVLPRGQNRAGDVWVTSTGDLPSFAMDDPPFWQDTELINERMASVIGADVTVLRPAAVGSGKGMHVRVYLLEAHGAALGRWAPASSLADPVPGCSVAEVCRPLVNHPMAVPWYRPGWYATAASWIRDALAHRGITAMHQFRSWGLSTLVRVESENGRYWFKANGPPFADEIAKTATLARRFPEVMPHLEVADVDLGWAIFDDLGRTSLNDHLEPQGWAAAGQMYARMQIDSIDLREDLVRAGFQIHDEARIARDIERMVADEDTLTAGDHALDVATVEAVRHRATEWGRAILALGELGIPLAIEHGDLHSGQMLIDDRGRVRVLDWSDVTLSNPLISLDTFVSALHRNLGPHLEQGHVATLEAAFGEAYLAEWASVVDRSTLEEGGRLVRMAAAPLEAIPFWRMLPNMEQRWEFENVVPQTLGSAVT
jgi:hypothetical protein